MKKKRDFHLKSKHMIVLMSLLCISLLAGAATSGFSAAPIKNTVGYVVMPFQNGINKIGSWLTDVSDNFKNVKQLAKENEALKKEIDDLKAQNNTLVQQQTQLQRLEELYKLDQTYADYPKVLAQVISKDPGNWYSTFVIDKGSKDGMAVDMNVLAGEGLAGIIIEVGPHWSTVRSIIDDSSNVSAMSATTSETCVVTGDLQLIDSGHLRFSKLHDEKGSVQVGEGIVTSHISDKYLKGILIGYVSDVQHDANNLTSSGQLVPAADFRHLQEVLVITQQKQTKEGQ